jgi:chromosome segregation ATPase
MSIQIESDLKEILNRIEKRFDKVDEKFEELGKTVNDINVRLAKVETKLNSELPAIQKSIDEIKSSQQAQIWTLIGILFTAVTGFLVAVGKFVINSNP